MSELDVKRYLETELPALLRMSRLDKCAVIQWVIVDRDDCDLVYRISDDALEVSQELADDVDLTLAFVSADLALFREKKLDVARAVRTRRLKITGDTALVEWMAERLGAVAGGAR